MNIPLITFLVQGSSPTPYKVKFTKTGSNISAFCTCPAGINGQYCKHRFRILDGDSTGIISNNLEDIKTVASWMTGSDIEVAIKRVKELELSLRKVEAELSKLKKQVAKAMRD
jgi:hypothetical protein